MRSGRVNLTTVMQKYYSYDEKRGLVAIRNLHATETIFFNGGNSHKRDAFPILAGDVLTLERGHIADEIWLASDTVAHDSVVILVT